MMRTRHLPAAPSCVIAIPARNEAALIGPCLRALDAAIAHAGIPARILLLLNGCTDATAQHARTLQPSLAATLRLEEANGLDSAGLARRHAMALAGDWNQPDILLTTDADSRVAPDWLRANIAALRAGADAVAGRIAMDPADILAIPPALRRADAAESAYAALLDEITSRLDPDPADPWPRHDCESGASIAVRRAAWQQAGGIPAVAHSEDRLFFDALRRIDAAIRHAPEVFVTVSGRLEGRAEGGMAATIRRRLQQPDLWLDDRLQPVAELARRIGLRAQLRRHALGLPAPALETLAPALELPVAAIELALALPGFGAAWARLQAVSPALARSRVVVESLPAQMQAARALRDRLPPADDAATDPADTRLPAAAAGD